MNKILIAFLTVFTLGACSSTPSFLENRVVCTVDKQEAHTVSKWGPVGVASKISEKDREVICK